jgi:molybdopterin molybdotransferase
MAAAGKGLVPVEEALRRILVEAQPTGSEDVALLEARGRVLAAPLRARLTQPPFDASAMDGYAVRGADVATLPARLRVIGEAAAGRGFAGRLGAGEAVRIFTGAPLPAGADAIVIQENTQAEDGSVTVVDGRPDAAHVRRRGFDFAEGATLLAPDGRRLGARQITLAAAMGHAALAVRRRPVVVLLATGDELVLPGAAPGADQIVCSNPFGLATLVAEAGGEPRFLGIAADDRGALSSAIDRAAGADILVTIGGASVGDHDLVAPVLESKGMALEFWQIAMRPGKPLMFGRLGHQLVIGLPGNPVSALICGRVFVVPLVQAMLGLPAGLAATEPAVAAVSFEANGARTHYMRAVIEPQTAGGPPRVRPIRSQDSSLLSPLAAADALVVRPVGAPAVPAGGEVAMLRLDF